MKKIIYLFLLLQSTLILNAQKGKLFAGPLVGSVTKNSAKVWIGYKGKGNNAIILGDTQEHKIIYPTNLNYTSTKKGKVSLTMDFTGLKPNHFYNVLVAIQGSKSNSKCSFQTLKDTTLQDFSFITGSCNLLNTDYLRPFLPGFSTIIFKSMKKQKPAFMLWLGDNVYYLRHSQTKDFDHLFMRNLRTRQKFPLFKDFLSSCPHYAIWDDHDFGPNDSGTDWYLKDTTLKVFKSFWPNTYPEQPQFNGNYFTFRQYDCEFFMLDCRYFRGNPKDSTAPFLGETQLIWLKNKLLMSDASFKFICIGTQVLNQNKFGESYADYARERRDLLNFITQKNIPGVLFLTGDKHYSEVCLDTINDYPIYDFTCSPLTSPVLPRRILGAYQNKNRIPNTDLQHRNFGKISISGSLGNRKCSIQIINKFGKTKRKIELFQSQLIRH